jgi:nitrogen fixation-related uncharacterized protein
MQVRGFLAKVHPFVLLLVLFFGLPCRQFEDEDEDEDEDEGEDRDY